MDNEETSSYFCKNRFLWDYELEIMKKAKESGQLVKVISVFPFPKNYHFLTPFYVPQLNKDNTPIYVTNPNPKS